MEDKKDPLDGEYIGNIFGPKNTKYGIIILLFFIALAVYRHWSLGVPFGMVPEEGPVIDTLIDTLITPQ